MSIFGSSLPPGCHRLPDEEPDPPCDVCGKDIDWCVCPECPICGETGNIKCYQITGAWEGLEDHNLQLSKEQLQYRIEVKQAILAQREQDNLYAEQYLADKSAEEKK